MLLLNSKNDSMSSVSCFYKLLKNPYSSLLAENSVHHNRFLIKILILSSKLTHNISLKLK